MKQILTIVTFIMVTNLLLGQKMDSELDKYTDFLKLQNNDAKNYIINLWKKYDVVILCERNHGEMTQYDLMKEGENA